MGDPAAVLRQQVRDFKESLRGISERAGITPEEYTKKFENFIHPGLDVQDLMPLIDHLVALESVSEEFRTLWEKKLRVSPVFWENAFASRAFGALEEVRLHDDILKRYAKLFRGENKRGPNHKKPRKRNARKGRVHNGDGTEPSQEAVSSDGGAGVS